MMGSICRNAESDCVILAGKGFVIADSYKNDAIIKNHVSKEHGRLSEFAHSIADAAVAAAYESDAKSLITFTTSSHIAIFVPKRRPSMPIIAVTPTPSIYRRLALHYGVYPVISLGIKDSLNPAELSRLRSQPFLHGS